MLHAESQDGEGGHSLKQLEPLGPSAKTAESKGICVQIKSCTFPVSKQSTRAPCGGLPVRILKLREKLGRASYSSRLAPPQNQKRTEELKTCN